MRTTAWFGWSAAVLVLGSCAVTACGTDADESLIPDFDGGTAGDASRDGSATKSDGAAPGTDGSTPGKDTGTSTGDDDDDVVLEDSGVDAGEDSGVDAGEDSGVDAGVEDSGLDAGTDAGVDAGQDSGAEEDSGVDAGEDAGVDSGEIEDAGATEDAGIDAGDSGSTNTCKEEIEGISAFLPLTSASRPVGAKIHYGACAESTMVALSAPYAFFDVSAEPGGVGYLTASYGDTHRVTLTTYLTAEDGETPLVVILANSFASPFDATKAHALISVEDDTIDESCSIEGVTVALPGHAEGVASYLDANGNDQGASLSAGSGGSGASGFAYLSGLTPGADFTGVTLGNLPAGCQVTYFYTDTGRTPLVANTVSVLSVVLSH